MDIWERLASLQQACQKEFSEKEAISKQKIKQEGEIRRLKDAGTKKEIMKELLQKASEKAREDAKKVLSETCTNAVQMVLDDRYSVDMQTSIKSGVPHVELLSRQITADGQVIETDPANEEGGGVGDIISIATFMSLGMLVGDNNRAPYFLDEPTKFVSKGNSENVAKFLKEMAAYSGKQTFLVTHDQVVAESADRAFRISKDNDTRVSTATEIMASP